MKKTITVLLALTMAFFSCDLPIEHAAKAGEESDTDSATDTRAFGGTNLALSAVACTTDSNYDSSYPGSNAKDGSQATKWCSTNATSDHWIKYNLGGVKNITGFIVRHSGSNPSELPITNTRYFQVRFARADNAWETVVSVDNSGQANVTEQAVPAVQAQYVMMYITDCGADDWARIYEFEVWGSAIGGNNAEIQEIYSSVPVSMAPGETRAVRIRAKNSGGTVWSSSANYRLGAAPSNAFTFSAWQYGGYANSTTDARVFLNPSQNIYGGGAFDFNFNITAPGSSGTYKLSVRMVRDGYEWFGETQTWNIIVIDGDPTPQPANGFEKGIECGAVFDTSTSQAASDLGAEWVRLNFICLPEWSGPSDPGFFACYDSIVNGYVSKGLKVYGLIGAESVKTGYDRNAPQNFIEPLKQAAYVIMQRYADRVKVFEIFNEPNDWAGGNTAQVSELWFARFIAAAYRQKITLGLNDVTIVSGPVLCLETPEFYVSGKDYIYNTYVRGITDPDSNYNWETIYNQRGTYPLDGIGYHMYVFQGSTNATQITVSINKNLDEIWQGSAAGENYNGRNPYPAKKIWISEIGWQSSQVTDAGQAVNLITAFKALKSNSRVRMGLWFTLNDWPDATWGLRRLDGSHKPAWDAFVSF